MRVQKKTKHLPIDSIDHSHNSVLYKHMYMIPVFIILIGKIRIGGSYV